MPGMEDLYREIILDHYRSPRNRGELPVPPAHSVTGFNPLCGDEITLYLQVDGGVLNDIKISGQGCSISQSSASLMSAAVKARTLGEIRELLASFKGMMSIHEGALSSRQDSPDEAESQAGTAGSAQMTTGEGEPTGQPGAAVEDLGELAALQGVVKFPVRIKCATLPWNALLQGLDEIASGVASTTDGAGNSKAGIDPEEMP